MGRLRNNERYIKLKTLRVAIILLRRESKEINFVTVREKANEIGFPKYFTTKISKGSLEKPSSEEYKDLKTTIEKCKNENKKIKNATKTSVLKKIKNLELKVDDLTFNIASLLERERELLELLESKEKTLIKMRMERDNYISRIN
ncbi:hypothetical protein [Aliarcobacter butzleri]|uniref:hypothetical protein n=1 Tax=Aliarcobacter butzleri TaxID=28197 RepID=UPI001EDB76DE|nr:hypothetical protein [Aliarcobacter butzleri]MCG3684522.1 hypothetical protein [Aliarcobacter butzleri]